MNSASASVTPDQNMDIAQEESKQGSRRSKRCKSPPVEYFPTQPTIIQIIKAPRGKANHSYKDFSQVKPEADYRHPKEIKDMTFSQKVHHILSEPEHEKCISWLPHGRAFKVHIPLMFETKVCPKYFGHKRYSSFLRELNNHGFKHITKGVDRNSYYHQYMLKDRPHLCAYMPSWRDARRLLPDPQNEPNFYEISRRFPLDGTAPADGDANESKLPVKRARRDNADTMSMVNHQFPTLVPLSVPAIPPRLPSPASFSVTATAGSCTPFVPTVAATSLARLESVATTKILMAVLEEKQKQERQNAMLAALVQQRRNQLSMGGFGMLFSTGNEK